MPILKQSNMGGTQDRRKMKKIHFLVLFIVMSISLVLNMFILENPDVKIGSLCFFFFISILLSKIFRRKLMCKYLSLLETIIALIYFAIAGGVILGPTLAYLLEFSVVIIVILVPNFQQKNTLSFIRKKKLLNNIKNALIEKQTEEVYLFVENKKIFTMIYFILILAFFPVIFWITSIWVLLGFAFSIFVLVHFFVDNQKYMALFFKNEVLLFNETEKFWASRTEFRFSKNRFVKDKKIFVRDKYLEKDILFSMKYEEN